MIYDGSHDFLLILFTRSNLPVIYGFSDLSWFGSM